jgi:F-type H+/Na+-transporting ATPase subunit alpha
VQDFLAQLIDRLKSEHAELIDRMNDGELSDEDEEALGKAIAEAIDDFGPDFDEEGQPLEEGESDRVRSDEERSKPGRTDQEAELEADAEKQADEAEKTVEQAERETEDEKEEVTA